MRNAHRPLDNMTTLAVSSARAIWRRASAHMGAESASRLDGLALESNRNLRTSPDKGLHAKMFKVFARSGFFPHLTRVWSGSNNMQNN